MNIQFDKAKLNEMLTKKRVDDFCLLLPHVARAVGSYNRELKKQGVDKDARKACLVALSDRLFTAPMPTPQQTSEEDYYE